MKVQLAEHAGFCFGVKRSLNLVYEQLNKSEGSVYTWGPMIHNRIVVEDLEAQGVTVLSSVDELESLQSGTIVIRSHGVSKKVFQELKNTGLNIVDGTCPFVKKIHRIVQQASGEGKQVVVIGTAGHPEVDGICGRCEKTPAIVVSGAAEAAQFCTESNTKLCIVSQTTNNYNIFKESVEIISEKGYDIECHNSICEATSKRQASAAVLSEQADAMIVIGDPSSSNSRKLYEICKERCNNTYFIQNKDDLKESDFGCFDYVGITAGASTPNNIIEEVQNYVRNKF